MKNNALYVAGMIFAFLSIVHFIRLFYPFDVIIAGYNIPIWFSGIAFISLGLLSAWMFRAMKDYRSDDGNN